MGMALYKEGIFHMVITSQLPLQVDVQQIQNLGKL
jgi:hypothetical protein